MVVTDQYSTEAQDRHCVSPSAAADALAGAPWQRLVVIGDSVAAGIMDPLPGYRPLSFADRLAEALATTRPSFSYRNLAERDLRLGDIRERQLPAALADLPDVALVAAGGNDALGHGFDATQVRRDLRALLEPLAEAGVFVVTVGLFDLARSGLMPAHLSLVMAERFDALDAITAGLTVALGGRHVDTHHHPLTADPTIYAQDRIHANARGHAVAFAAIVQELATVEHGPDQPMD